MSLGSIVARVAGRAWRARLPTLLAAAWLGIACALPARADPPGRVGRIAEVVGPVWQLDHEHGEWVEATRNHPVVCGDRLRTDRDGRAVVQIGSATLRVAGFTEVEWLQLDDERVRLAVYAGSVGLRVHNAETAREHEIVALPGRFLPRTAGHFRVDRFDGASAGQAIVGEMVFEADDSRKRIDAGQRFEFWTRGEPPVTYHDTVVATTDDFGLWLLDAERREPREALATRYVSPETTGWEDLNRYGRWDRHPEFGVVWLPWSVTVGWAPYRYGRWVWVRPWGWTWVDAMPWGFAPFHYGRWVWWGGRWAWVPGPWVARPVYSPALVGWIGAPNASIGFSIGTGPWVGWVPLAPHDVYRPWYRVTPRPPHHAPPRVPGWRPPARAHASGYALLDVPGAVTAVSPDVLTRREPIAERDLRRLDPGTVRRHADRPDAGAPPPRPLPRTSTGAPPTPALAERPPGVSVRGDARERDELRSGPGERDARPRGDPRDGTAPPALPRAPSLPPSRPQLRPPPEHGALPDLPPSQEVRTRPPVRQPQETRSPEDLRSPQDRRSTPAVPAPQDLRPAPDRRVPQEARSPREARPAPSRQDPTPSTGLTAVDPPRVAPVRPAPAPPPAPAPGTAVAPADRSVATDRRRAEAVPPRPLPARVPHALAAPMPRPGPAAPPPAPAADEVPPAGRTDRERVPAAPRGEARLRQMAP